MNIDNNKIALGVGEKFYFYKKEDIPFFDELKKTNNKIVFNNNLYDIYKGKNDVVKKRVRFFTKENKEKYDYADYSLLKYMADHSKEFDGVEKGIVKDITQIISHKKSNLSDEYLKNFEDDHININI